MLLLVCNLTIIKVLVVVVVVVVVVMRSEYEGLRSEEYMYKVLEIKKIF